MDITTLYSFHLIADEQLIEIWLYTYNMTNEPTTHFGYQQVTESQKTEKVRAVFDSVSDRYDLMNDLMSMGVHRIWKKFTIDTARAKLGQHILDIAGGTGDLAKEFSKIVGSSGQVILADINAAMLNAGRNKLIDEGIFQNIIYVQANAECLPFMDNTFNCITIAFGLRNVTHIDQALMSMLRVLKPGGMCLILEFSKPVVPGLMSIYDWYSFNILPKLGKWIVNDNASYQYLVESIRMHPDQTTLKQKMLAAGFDEVEYFNLSGGIVALHKGCKY